ncbi:hypothetical protein [Lacticaseibacillus salsurivasis]|uniref:hypothetical protein n=1 Tax=Lacticaseibacillus salsurivasis TaxID=3081441 RepID=UPI0030C65BC4
MLKGKTSTGFAFEISDERQNNYELLEAFGKLEENPALLPRTVEMLLGAKQASGLKDHVRAKSGIVPADKMMDELKEILESQNQLKKS